MTSSHSSTCSTPSGASSGSFRADLSRCRPAARTGTSFARSGFPDPSTFLPTFERLSAWVDAALAEAGVPPERLVLAGFSQGAVMAHSLGLAAGRPTPAGIVAFSGFIPRVDGFDIELGSRAGLPVAVSHGSLDPVISVQFGRDARARLQTAGLDVRYVEEPIGHTIGPAALAQACALVADAVA